MSLNRFSLEGRVALITGGTSGLGRAMALGYRDAGGKVVVTTRNPAGNQAIAEALGGDGAVVILDVRDEASVKQAMATSLDRFGRLDILVNNAGAVEVEHAWEASRGSWSRVLDTNLTGAFLCAKHASRTMMSQGQGGKIINVSSVIAHLGPPDFAGYAASKAGLLGLTRALAVELAHFGIQVNALLPGYFYTDMSSGVPASLREQLIRKTPAGRWGDPDDLVGAAIFLASDASRYVTGSTVTVDGGYSVGERLREG
jgi:NAD(P)-dependent dehydrogenase (short-subunit alcohol dehydrogenase family)